MCDNGEWVNGQWDTDYRWNGFCVMGYGTMEHGVIRQWHNELMGNEAVGHGVMRNKKWANLKKKCYGVCNNGQCDTDNVE